MKAKPKKQVAAKKVVKKAAPKKTVKKTEPKKQLKSSKKTSDIALITRIEKLESQLSQMSVNLRAEGFVEFEIPWDEAFRGDMLAPAGHVVVGIGAPHRYSTDPRGALMGLKIIAKKLL